jgi:signal transduction histidine kinase
MKDLSRVLGSDDSEQLKRKSVRFPLWLKAVLMLLLTMLPLAGAGALCAYLWWLPGDNAHTMSILLAQQLTILGYQIREYYIFILALALIGLGLGFMAFEHYFIAPIRSLLAWMSIARATDFAHVPILPPLRRDEIGELGRVLSSSAAYFSQTKNQNEVLMGEKTLFMTIAAHQLRTPLTGLLWSIDAFLAPDATPEGKQQIMTDVDALLKRMRLIVNHILASANVEGGRYGYVFEKIDLIPVIEKLITEFRPVAESHGVTVGIEHGAVFTVYADAERITLALFDLISNAIDYTPKGGKITVSVNPHGKRLEVAVVDTGIGISEVEIPSLFRKFYRSDRARHMRPDGSGLGLFLVKNIISSHGSDITVTSKEGSGSRFAFFLDSEKKPDDTH